jgi:hypothetical protein
MRKVLLWLGSLLVGGGVVVVGASVAMTAMKGGSPSINLGDPTKFQFILVPVWAIGLGLAVAGALCLVGWRRMKAA